MASLSSASAHVTLALVFSLPLLNAPLSAQGDTQHQVLNALEWREIGPANMGGRVTGVAGIPGNPNIFYVGGADGGVFRTTNAGVTFDVLFTDQHVYSVGALAIAPSDVNVIWLGVGKETRVTASPTATASTAR